MFSDISLTKNGKLAQFVIKDLDLAVVNAARRVILSEIPNVAISFDAYKPELNDIDILKNESALHNEFLGHRISLIPLCFDAATIETFDPMQFTFTLHVKNELDRPIDVTTKDIQVMYNAPNGEHTILGVANMAPQQLRDTIFPVDDITGDPILITRLKPDVNHSKQGEELHVTFRARKGIARTHARWSPVSLCTYEFVVDEEEAAKAKDALLASDEAKQDAKQKAILLNRFETLDRQRYYKKNAKHEPSEFKFSVESECRMSPVYIVNKAWDVLLAKIDRLIRALAEDDPDPSVCKLDRINDLDDFYAWSIYDEDHTIGNLLQSLMFNMLIPAKRIEYIGYHQPHPLERYIVVKIKFTTETSAFPLRILLEGLAGVQKTLTDAKNAWMQASAKYQEPVAPVAAVAATTAQEDTEQDTKPAKKTRASSSKPRTKKT